MNLFTCHLTSKGKWRLPGFLKLSPKLALLYFCYILMIKASCKTRSDRNGRGVDSTSWWMEKYMLAKRERSDDSHLWRLPIPFHPKNGLNISIEWKSLSLQYKSRCWIDASIINKKNVERSNQIQRSILFTKHFISPHLLCMECTI